MVPSAMDPLLRLRSLAAAAAARSHAPFSSRPAAAAALLSDGAWVAGVRLESSAFPTSIAAAQAALGAALALGRRDIVAVAQSEPFAPGEAGAWAAWLGGAPAIQDADTVHLADADLLEPAEQLSLVLPRRGPVEDEAALALAREAAQRAYTPASDFPVGAVLLSADGRLVAGANVEHPDWTRGLCAERVALAAAAAEGVGEIERVWVTCSRAPRCSPCGACRQVLSERAPAAVVIMDGHGGAAEALSVADLLPGGFDAAALNRQP